jgi:hypothetical protein
MMRAVQQLFWMTIYEWFDALRSRRAMVVFLLYMASSICTMYWSISILGRMESQLASLESELETVAKRTPVAYLVFYKMLLNKRCCLNWFKRKR